LFIWARNNETGNNNSKIAIAVNTLDTSLLRLKILMVEILIFLFYANSVTIFKLNDENAASHWPVSFLILEISILNYQSHIIGYRNTFFELSTVGCKKCLKK
jgi:hypothetical protein